MSPPPILLLVPLNFRPSYSTTLIFIIVAVVGVQEVNIHTYFMPEHKVLQPCTSVHTVCTNTSYEVLKSKTAKRNPVKLFYSAAILNRFVSHRLFFYRKSRQSPGIFVGLIWSLCPLANSYTNKQKQTNKQTLLETPKPVMSAV